MKKRTKKRTKRIFGVVLAGAMILGTMSGCGAEESPSSEASVIGSSAVGVANVETVYPLDTDETLSIAIVNDKPVAAVSKSITGTPFAKAWAEQTGVELEFIVVEDNQAMNILFADGDLPDIIYWRPYVYAGGPEKAIADGVMLPITEKEMQTYAPDYMAALDAADPDCRRTVKTDDGDYIGFGMIMDDPALQNSAGMLLRADWLEEFGMEVPTNIEEFEAYLQACVDKGIEHPFPSSEIGGPLGDGLWTTPFGLVAAYEYQIDGVVHCGWAEPEYKDVLAWLKSLADRGLMDTSFTKYENGIYGGKQACWFAAVGSGIGTYMAYAEDPASGLEGFDVVAMPSFGGPNGEEAMAGYSISTKPMGAAYCWITPACENKELALQFLNYGYTEAGNLLFNFGVEGESYEMVDGVPTYTEWITHNPDGLSMQQAMAQYNRAAVGGGGGFVQSVVYADQYFWREQQKDATVTWSEHDGAKYRLPQYQVAGDDAAEFSKISADIQTYKDEARVKFITGEWSLDDYESVYLKTLYDMGYERYLEILQEACDRFYAR